MVVCTYQWSVSCEYGYDRLFLKVWLGVTWLTDGYQYVPNLKRGALPPWQLVNYDRVHFKMLQPMFVGIRPPSYKNLGGLAEMVRHFECTPTTLDTESLFLLP